MYKVDPLTSIDVYKLGHMLQYPEGTTRVYCNLTPRNFKYLEPMFPKGFFHNKAVVYGLRAAIQEVVESFDELFFKQDIDAKMEEFSNIITPFMGDNDISIIISNFRKLHKLGYLPLSFKGLPEGTQVSPNIPMMTWVNTHDDFAWLPNYLETFLSSNSWKLSTCSTIAKVYRNIFESFATKTGIPHDFVDFQGHDFSSRGMSGIMDASKVGSAHLTSFKGSDAISSIPFINHYYNQDKSCPFIGTSVPASEHSVMCLGGKDTEIETCRRLMKLYPTGVVSIVYDTWDYWKGITESVKVLKDDIMARQKDSMGFCKTVFRPDSGCPEDIICGTLKTVGDFSDKDFDTAKDYALDYIVEEVREETPHGEHGDSEPSGIFKHNGKYFEMKVDIMWNRHDKQYYFIDETEIVSCEEIQLTPQQKGSVECLDEIFGHTLTETGYKLLDEHVGLIYGDSITPHRAYEILDRLEKKGYASGNIVCGVGSFSYQGNMTRDSLGFAIKATYAKVNGNDINVYKDPKTDPGKTSAKGLLRVDKDSNGEYVLVDDLKTDEGGYLKTMFTDGKWVDVESFEDIRQNLLK